MKLRSSTTLGNVAKMMADEVVAAETAATQTMKKAGNDLKASWRQQIVAAGLGRRVANSVRSVTYPKGDVSLRAASLVFSKAPQIVEAFDNGGVIRSKEGLFLAIPQPAAGKGPGGRRMTPVEWQKRRNLELRPVRLKNGTILLVADGARLNTKGLAVKSRAKTGRNQVTAIVFVLVPQVTLRKRLDLQGDVEAVSARVPNRLVREWNKRSRK